MAQDDRLAKIAEHIKKDRFAAHLGAVIEEIQPGYSRVSLTITPEMLNFHGIAHGGVVFSLGDMAFAAASNSHGQSAVALNVNISFLKATQVGDQLVAEAKELKAGGRTALYDIIVTEQQSGELVAKSQAMVYRRKKWFVPPEA